MCCVCACVPLKADSFLNKQSETINEKGLRVFGFDMNVSLQVVHNLETDKTFCLLSASLFVFLVRNLGAFECIRGCTLTELSPLAYFNLFQRRTPCS